MSEETIAEDYFRVLAGGKKFDKEKYIHRVFLNEIKRLIENPENTTLVNMKALAKAIKKAED